MCSPVRFCDIFKFRLRGRLFVLVCRALLFSAAILHEGRRRLDAAQGFAS